MKNLFTQLFIILTLFTQVLFAENAIESDEESTISENTSANDEESSTEDETYIEEFVEDFEAIPGFFKAYRDLESNKVFLEIEKDQLNKEFIYFAHILNGTAISGMVKGSYVDEGIFSIEKDFETLRFNRVLTKFVFDDDSPLQRSQGANTSNSTFSVFQIAAKNEEESLYLIDISGLLLSEALTPIVPIMSPDSYHQGSMSWGQISPVKSRILSVHNYEENTDFQVEYVIENMAPSDWFSRDDYEYEDIADPRNISVHVRYSFIEMPNNDFEPRIANQSIGYFSDRVTNLTSTEVTPYQDLIGKWNLKKKNPEKDLSEPIKPITFWIENTTPYELRDFIKEGVLAWNEAFEAAGFINAIEVKIQPDDAEWDAGDIRYNVLRWTSSPDPMFGGYGPSFTNPRTGEIIGADIMLEWIYLTARVNVDSVFNESNTHKHCSAGNYLQEGLLLAESLDLNDPKIIEQGIKRLALHEVGHTLGLNHNFKASYLNNPIDVHIPEITGKIGVTASVMEYPAINLAPVGVEQGDYYDVRPGPYDIWAIKYGYTPNISEDELDLIIKESDKPEHMFANDSEDMRYPGRGIDPRAMIYDLTNDPVEYAVQRMELVNVTQDGLLGKYDSKAESWEEYRLAHRILMREYGRSLEVISRQIGGVYVERSNPQNDPSQDPYTPVPYEEQKKAMKALQKYAFSTAAFPINSELLRKVQVERRMFDLYDRHEDPQMHKAILSIQNSVLNHILNAWTLARITDTELYGNEYSVYEVLNDLTNSIFTGDDNNEVSSVRRNIQTNYVRRLLEILGQDYYDEFATAAAYSSLRDIQKMVRKSSNDLPTKSHRKLISWIIESGLDRAQ